MTMVWLHTNSPPQHIATIEESVVRGKGALAAYLASVNERRGLSAEWAGAFEDARGNVSVHIFDTAERSRAWMLRNHEEMDLLTASTDA